MAEKVIKIGGILGNLYEAVKTAKFLLKQNTNLAIVTEQTENAGAEIEKLQIPDEPLLNELKRKTIDLRTSASNLEKLLPVFNKEVNSFDKYLNEKIFSVSSPPEITKEFIDLFENLYKMAIDFCSAYCTFVRDFNSVHELALMITESCNEKHRKLQEEANKKIDKCKIAGGLFLAGAGIAALAFFTCGIGLVAAVAVGAVVTVGAVGVKAYVDVAKLRSQADDFMQLANKLKSFAKNVTGIGELAGKIELDEKSILALKVALDFVKKEAQSSEKQILTEAQLTQYKQEMARKDEEMKKKEEEMAEFVRQKAEFARQKEEFAREKAELEAEKLARLQSSGK